MPTRKISYAASASVTITLASLAASSTWVAGRESTAVDNSSFLYIDYKFGGKITTGTSPTAGIIEIWLVPESNDATWPDVFDGTESVETATSRDILQASGRLMAFMVTDTTNDRSYPFQFNVLDRFSKCPRKFVLFVTHSTVAALNVTGGNHVVDYQGIYETVS